LRESFDAAEVSRGSKSKIRASRSRSERKLGGNCQGIGPQILAQAQKAWGEEIRERCLNTRQALRHPGSFRKFWDVFYWGGLALETVAQITHTVVGGQHAGVLLLDRLAHVEWQFVVLDRLAIFSDCGIFATLAFDQDGMLLVLRESGFEIHPTTTKRAAETATSRWLLAEIQDEKQQFRGKLQAFH
jgi:hypothetical protein